MRTAMIAMTTNSSISVNPAQRRIVPRVGLAPRSRCTIHLRVHLQAQGRLLVVSGRYRLLAAGIFQRHLHTVKSRLDTAQFFAFRDQRDRATLIADTGSRSDG